MLSVRPSSYGACENLGEHERSVRVAWGVIQIKQFYFLIDFRAWAMAMTWACVRSSSVCPWPYGHMLTNQSGRTLYHTYVIIIIMSTHLLRVCLESENNKWKYKMLLLSNVNISLRSHQLISVNNLHWLKGKPESLVKEYSSVDTTTLNSLLAVYMYINHQIHVP